MIVFTRTEAIEHIVGLLNDCGSSTVAMVLEMLDDLVGDVHVD